MSRAGVLGRLVPLLRRQTTVTTTESAAELAGLGSGRERNEGLVERTVVKQLEGRKEGEDQRAEQVNPDKKTVKEDERKKRESREPSTKESLRDTRKIDSESREERERPEGTAVNEGLNHQRENEETSNTQEQGGTDDAEDMAAEAARPSILAEMGAEAQTTSAMPIFPALGSSPPSIPSKAPSIASPPHLDITLQEPTPESQSTIQPPLAATAASAEIQRPEPIRRQSLAHSSEKRFIKALLAGDDDLQQVPTHPSHIAATSTATAAAVSTAAHGYFPGPPTLGPHMLHRKIWVRRPGASATLVQISEDDVVDDVRDTILRKYANSLGRFFDPPDLLLRIVPRAAAAAPIPADRVLGPEEPMARTLDAHYPGGQNVDEALIVDIPARRTPRHSPKAPLVANPPLPLPHYYVGPEDARPVESDRDYFPPMQLAHVVPATSPHGGVAAAGSQHSISILSTGQVPLLPSPGSRATRHGHRPRLGRTSTTSPTVLQAPLMHMGKSRIPSQVSANRWLISSDARTIHPAPPPTTIVPSSKASTPPIAIPTRRNSTPPPPARLSSPRPSKTRKGSGRRKTPGGGSAASPALPASLLDGAVPPINVLLVEDNIINLKLLEAFMKRLQLRWHAVMNGRDAVARWRTGGFHLVLMDIQLPVMNGLDATKEIRRLERVNGVGVGVAIGKARGEADVKREHREPLDEEASTEQTAGRQEIAGEVDGEMDEGDRLPHESMFKSPVIIVALTASSLQSDRHEALAAGCNDFLTKPVNFVWLERKVMEWGCMQALIDYSGWRRWKDLSASGSATATTAAATPATATATASAMAPTAPTAPLPITNGASAATSPLPVPDKASEHAPAAAATSGLGAASVDATLETKRAESKARRKAKRNSLGAGVGTGGLSGVAEDSEGEGKGRGES